MENRVKGLLSVIVPMYNASHSINRCVLSIIGQTYHNIEVILVDDGSNDNTKILCEELVGLDKRVNYFFKSNGGPSSARNYGIERSRGQYLAFADSDDYLERDYYLNMIQILLHSEAGMVISTWTEEYSDGNCLGIRDIGPVGVFPALYIKEQIVIDDYSAGGGFPWNRVIDTNRIAGNVIPNLDESVSIYEDKCWLLQVLDLLECVEVCSESGYHYRICDNSLSHNFTIEKYKDLIKAWNIIRRNMESGQAMSSPCAVRYLDCISGAMLKIKKMDKTEFDKEKSDYKKMFSRQNCSFKQKIKYIVLFWL